MINVATAQSTIKYIDGSNNDYNITKTQLQYVAVKKDNSSSGEYNGGNDATVSLSKEQFAQIQVYIKKLKADKTQHITTREMGCGTLILKKKTLFIAMNSKLLSDFNNYLKSILSQK